MKQASSIRPCSRCIACDYLFNCHKTPRDVCFCCPFHFADEETEMQQEDDLPQIPWLVMARAETQTWGGRLRVEAALPLTIQKCWLLLLLGARQELMGRA